MPLKIIRQDITKIKCDAIVNPTNRHMEPGGGADLAVHEAAGPELYEYCQKLGGCPVGTAVITPAFKLPCKFIIHTAGPDWYRVNSPRKLLISCYENCLRLAAENGCESLAMPLISSGAYGYPKDEVIRIATSVISDFLTEHEMMIYLLVFDKKAYEISQKLFCDIAAYIDDNYIAAHCEDAIVFNREWHGEKNLNSSVPRDEIIRRRRQALEEIRRNEAEDFCTFQAEKCEPVKASLNLENLFENMDKGFAETLFYYIDKKGMTDVECYKKSNVDKKTFSKIKCNKDYRPSKVTAVSFAIGLRLNSEEANHLLSTVGMCLSHASKFDVIIEYFIKTGNYKDIYEVNEVLYQFDQQLLGV